MAWSIVERDFVAETSPKTVQTLASLRQFIQFGMVGGSGVIVNLTVVYICKKFAEIVFALNEREVFLPLLGTDFNIRWYNVFTVVAFVIANIWNYQLNRSWTFKGVSSVGWIRGLVPFMITGIGALVVSQIVLVLLMNPGSPIALSESVFDDSTGLRTKFYWASALSILVSMPVNFVINKFWTFRKSPKGSRVVLDSPIS